MEWLGSQLGVNGFWQSLAAAGDLNGVVAVLFQRVVLVALVLIVTTFRVFHRQIPVLDSRNPYVSALGWVLLLYLVFGTMALAAPFKPPLDVWILLGVLAYGIVVVVKQIQQQPPE